MIGIRILDDNSEKIEILNLDEQTGSGSDLPLADTDPTKTINLQKFKVGSATLLITH